MLYLPLGHIILAAWERKQGMTLARAVERKRYVVLKEKNHIVDSHELQPVSILVLVMRFAANWINGTMQSQVMVPYCSWWEGMVASEMSADKSTLQSRVTYYVAASCFVCLL